MPQPTTLDEYREWAQATLGIDYDQVAIKTRYESNIQAALNTIQKSSFWQTLPAVLERCNEEHEARTSAGMLMSGEITLATKPYSSVVDKSFRHNVLWNRKYPDEPKGGWATPDTWYSAFDDLIRSTIVCKFIDGPEILTTSLTAHATQNILPSIHSARANERGYYAYHHYTTFQVAVADQDWNPHNVDLRLELQLTTQLQEVLRSLTHPLYESARLLVEPRDDKWKWEYNNPRFQTSYLGHTLHLIEAMIIQVRTASHAAKTETAQVSADVKQAEPENTAEAPNGTPLSGVTETQQ
jgi:hypothetical protein